MWGTALLSSLLWAIRVETGWGVLSWAIYSFGMINFCATQTNTSRSGYELTTWRQIFFESTIDDVVKNRIGYTLYWLSFLPGWRKTVLSNALAIDHKPTLTLLFKKNLPSHVYEEIVPSFSQSPNPAKWFDLTMEKTKESSPSALVPKLCELVARITPSPPYGGLEKENIMLMVVAMERLSQLLPWYPKADALALAKNSTNVFSINFTPDASTSSSINQLQVLHELRKKIITYTQADEQTIVFGLEQLKQKERLAKEELLTRLPRSKQKLDMLQKNATELASCMEKRLLTNMLPPPTEQGQASPKKRRM